MLRLTAFLLFLTVVSAFKLGQDSPYQRAWGGGGAAFHKGSVFNTGSFPQGVAYTQREKYAPKMVETIVPLGGNVVTTNPALNSNNDPWYAPIATVVAAGPLAAVKEGDLVYVSGACTGIFINNPSGAQGTKICRAKAAGGATDKWCQIRGCSGLVADKCEWIASPTAIAPVAQYCQNPTMLGKVQIDSYGANRAQAGVSHLLKPRGIAMARRSEPLNQDYPNGM